MKVTLKDIPYGLAEIGQPNPLRWAICKPVKPDEFEQVSTWIKCKDFFNDLTYTIQTGKNFSIYGFNASVYSPPKKGNPVYFALKDLRQEFFPNMELLNEWLRLDQKVDQITVEKTSTSTALITVPGFFFKNTYYTSLITLLIRLMSSPKKFETFNEAVTWSMHPTQEQNLINPVIKKNWWFKDFPEEGKKFVWHAGPTNNSEKNNTPYISTLVHNNGVLGWMNSGIK